MDCGLLEHALFHNPVFEQRSLKHASRREFGRRMGEMMRCYEWGCSMDFGAFDGSCTKECRDLIENDIVLSLFMKLLDVESEDGLLHAAVRDRIKNKANISVKNVVKAVVWDMIRESGDRGTSILNFLTNLTLFYANMSLQLEKRGVKEKTIKKMIQQSIATGDLANLMGEGDDGLQVFRDAFIRLIGDTHTFGKDWCDGYAEFGFKIEPQGPEGDLSFDECIVRTSERMEFCSKVAVSVGDETLFFPKLGKLSNSLTVSFDTSSSRSDAGFTKAVAMMSNCIHQPLLFELCRSIAEGHKADGAELDVKSLRKMMGPHEMVEPHGYMERLIVEHTCFIEDSDAPAHMMKALERETGISVADQEEAMIGLRTGNRETVTACLKALRQ